MATMTRLKRDTRRPDTSGLDATAAGRNSLPTVDSAYALYERGRSFNSAINLDETVRLNENFYIGKQWEGVTSNGLPTPTFNILKRVACFTVANICSDNIKVTASPLAASPNTSALAEPVRIVNEELEALTERNKIPSLMREFARNAAVDADGCLYTYWDAEAETGQEAKGAIRTEVLQNTRVHFGNPNDFHVQAQPYIIIESRDTVRDVRDEAKANGCENWENITADSDNTNIDSAKMTDNKVTRLLLLWRDKKTKEIWGYEFTRTATVRPAWNLGIRLYPLVWLNWDYVQDCYHGQAMITGLLPNQIFINKIYAMSQLSMMTTAFPKVIYDKTRIKSWDNAVGRAIGVHGSIADVAKNMDPAVISPQISQFIQLTVEQTEQTLGATSVALGDTRPDNTSAIIALQRAAATPSEMTKQNLYQAIEDMYRIYVEFIAEYYGKRFVDIATPDELKEAAAFAGGQIGDEISVLFNFGQIKDMPMVMKMDVGAGTYYSEIQSAQQLYQLLQLDKISVVQYLERMPDGSIPARQSLIRELKAREMAQPALMPGAPPSPAGQMAPQAPPGTKPAIPTGGGYSALQRKVNEAGTTEGVV